uniref:uncharacterized protein LOC122600220 isoform X1 n=1 Tax=Erigeron canadensis TaxID=72917 RepID=UPI001CB9BAC7|nr:uncharacterized protein LOC122600220 isoform X1 [Erigeron canadensis]
MGERTVKKNKKTSNNKPLSPAQDNVDGVSSDKKLKKSTRDKKRKGTEVAEAKKVGVVGSSSPVGFYDGENGALTRDKKRTKLKKNKVDNENRKNGVREHVPQSNEVANASHQQIEVLMINADNKRIKFEEKKGKITAGKVDSANSDKKLKKSARKKNRKGTELSEAETIEVVVPTTSDDVIECINSAGKKDKKKNKLKKKKRENGNKKDVVHEVGDDSNQQFGKSKRVATIENEATLLDDEDEVYQISSGDEDETTGMKRWIDKYHRARPGAEVLLENINDFLVDYNAQKDKERKEKDEEAAEGGWTVVTHMKGRKKTTDAESGTTVGSVAQAAVMDKMSKKKDKQVGINFYRFQKREAQRNEIMTLQSQFEQDKKRIQQLRAARKFRPY